MITLHHADNRTIGIPTNAAIITDPPYGCSNNCDYTRFTGGLSPSRNRHRGIVGDEAPFDPSRWLAYPYVALFGFQFFANSLPLGTTLVWLKKRDNQLGSFLSDCELAWLKGGGKGCYLYRHVWHGFDRETERGKTLHPTQKPVALMEWVIQRAKIPKGTTIVDPYCGSGATLIAANNLGYDAIGIEVDETYYQIAKDRCPTA